MMKYFGEALSGLHQEFNRLLRKKDCFDEAVQLFLYLHSFLHLSQVSGCDWNEVDSLCFDLTPDEAAAMPEKKGESIAWAVWHIARIEDLTMNMLVARKEQVFTPEIQRRIRAPVTDTGNALSQEEIRSFGKKVDFEALAAYRNEVGARTRSIVQALSPEDVKRPVEQSGLDAILAAGGVTGEKDSVWLLEYWGTKDVGGLLLMPATRHLMLHLNDCCKWKAMLRAK
jgi:Protein of unknown function (DUF664).